MQLINIKKTCMFWEKLIKNKLMHFPHNGQRENVLQMRKPLVWPLLLCYKPTRWPWANCWISARPRPSPRQYGGGGVIILAHLAWLLWGWHKVTSLKWTLWTLESALSMMVMICICHRCMRRCTDCTWIWCLGIYPVSDPFGHYFANAKWKPGLLKHIGAFQNRWSC